MPSAMLRFSGGKARPRTPEITLNVTPDKPTPIRTPADITNCHGAPGCAISTNPRTYSNAPPSTTRPEPYLSASMPANGCVAPHTRFCTASASANVSRLQCRSPVIGCRKSPKPWRMPIPNVRTKPPQTSTTVGVRQSAARTAVEDTTILFRRSKCVASASARRFLAVGVQRLQLAEQRDQRVELGLADTPRDILLRMLPKRLGAAARGGAFRRDRDLARPRVPSRLYDDKTALDQRIEIAGERGAIEKLPRREIGNGERAVGSERAQERKLGDAQRRRRHRVVIELRQGTGGAAESAAGAGRRRQRRTRHERIRH